MRPRRRRSVRAGVLFRFDGFLCFRPLITMAVSARAAAGGGGGKREEIGASEANGGGAALRGSAGEVDGSMEGKVIAGNRWSFSRCLPFNILSW